MRGSYQGVRRARLMLAAILLAAFTASAVHAEGAKLPPELDAVRGALAKYADPVVAVRDGYFSTLGCVYYRDGGMGIHFINPALLGPQPDPMEPQLLLHEPEGGKLRLSGRNGSSRSLPESKNDRRCSVMHSTGRWKAMSH